MSSLAVRLMSRYRETLPKADHAATMEEIKRRITEYASQCCNRPVIEFFGSIASGFCKENADIDLSLRFSGYDPLLVGNSKVEAQNAKKLIRLSRALVGEGNDGVKYIKCRTPVVQFLDAVTSRPVDITLGNVGGVDNSRILHRIGEVAPIIAVYVYLVKEWGKAREVVAAEKESFNSFTMTVMSMMVLQEVGLLPTFGYPTGDCGELTYDDVDRTLKAFTVPEKYRIAADDDQALGDAALELLNLFAQYYSAFDFKAGTVSIICPRRLRSKYAEIVNLHLHLLMQKRLAAWDAYHNTKGNGEFVQQEFDEAREAEIHQRPSHTPYVVEDFVNYINCGRRVKDHRVKHISDEFVRLRETMKNLGQDKIEDQIFAKSNKFSKKHHDDFKDWRVMTFTRN